MDRREEWKDFQFIKDAAKAIVPLAKQRINELPEKGPLEKNTFAEFRPADIDEREREAFKYGYMFYIAFRFYHDVNDFKPNDRVMEACVNSCGYVSSRILCIGTVDELCKRLDKEDIVEELTEIFWTNYQNLDNDDVIH